MVGFALEDLGKADGLSKTATVACEEERADSKAVGSLSRYWFSKMENEDAKGTCSRCKAVRLDEQRT